MESRPHYFTIRLRTQAGAYIKVCVCVCLCVCACPFGASHGLRVHVSVHKCAGKHTGCKLLPVHCATQEFCHGDFGRSIPSLGQLIVGEEQESEPPRVEILQLDVLAVHMDDWP